MPKLKKSAAWATSSAVGAARQLGVRRDQRDHDLRAGVDLPALAGDHRLDDRRHLHDEDLRIGDRQPATAVAEHRVHLVQRGDPLLDLPDRDVERSGQLALLEGFVRQELVQRRVQQANRYGKTSHRSKDSLEVALLIRQQLLQR